MKYVKFTSNVRSISAAIQAARTEAMLQTGADVVSVTKQLAPVKSGELRNSYGAVPIDSDTVQVGTVAEHAPFVEYGTSRSQAQPHLTPAATQAQSTYNKRLKQAIEKRLKR